METATKIIKVLLKDYAIKPTVTSIAKEMDMSRVGIWKNLKRLADKNIIILTPIGEGKTSIQSISLNWENPIVEKTLSLALTEDALKHQRWLSNFSELNGKVDFLIIYGSILHSPKEANDIDIMMVTTKNKFIEVEESIRKIQKTQGKKIHAMHLTPTECKIELEKPNQVFIDAVKKGIILFGQEKFIKFLSGVRRT